jgi:signal transduction histidine kinase
MVRGLSTELASELKTQLDKNEDWLIKRILYYAKRQGYTAYTSTLEEAWRASIAGLNRPLLETPSTNFWMLELHPHFDFMNDTYANFGVLEAKKHRERGVDLIMFLGLFKYYRQSYEDLLYRLDFEAEDIEKCRKFMKRYFDRIELGFMDEWTRASRDEINEEMASRNRELTNEKTLFLTVLESLNQPVVVTDGEGRVKLMNQAAAELFEGESAPGRVYYGGQRPQLPEVIENNVLKFIKNNAGTQLLTQTIKERIYDISYSRMKDVSGKFLGLAVIMNDITAKKRTENVLHESENLRKAVMEGVDAAAMILDMEMSEVVDYNSKVTALFGKNIETEGFTDECPRFYEELGGKSASVFELAAQSVNNEERLLEQCGFGTKYVRLFTLEVWFQSRRHKIMIIFDITREKMLEKRANHLQQLEVLGDIAGSLPCMMSENIDKIMREITKCSHHSPDAMQGAQYLKDLVGALESIVQYNSEMTAVNLNQLVKNCITLTRDKWQPYADIDLQFAFSENTFYCAPDEMGQVFLNLLMNSAYAVRKKFEAEGERGLITIKSRNTAGFFEFKFADNGIGIKKEFQKRVFDPGFSTKEVGRVTGSGLVIVYDIIVKRYKGTIEFKSTEGKGTEFTLRLPKPQV